MLTVGFNERLELITCERALLGQAAKEETSLRSGTGIWTRRKIQQKWSTHRTGFRGWKRCRVKCTGWPTECAPFGPFFSVGMGPFGRSGRPKFRCGSQISSSLLGLSLPFWESKNIKVWSVQKSFLNTSGSTKNACCLRHCFTNVCFLPREKCTSEDAYLFEISSSLLFALCFVPSAARSSKEIMSRGASFHGFWTLWPILRFTELKILVRDASQNSRVLPRVVCLFGAVGFCGGVFERRASECHDHCSKKKKKTFWCRRRL